MDGYEHSHNELEALRSIFQETSPFVGEEYLKALVKGLGECLKADTTFVAYALDDPPARVRGITVWKNGAFRESWEYDLAGNPCELTYNSHPTFIPSNLAAQFPAKSDSNYESYLGAPQHPELCSGLGPSLRISRRGGSPAIGRRIRNHPRDRRIEGF